MTRRVRGARGHLDGHAPKSKTRSIKASSKGGNAADGKHVASTTGDVDDNGGMTCGVKVSGGVVE